MPKQIASHGLKPKSEFDHRRRALRDLIRYYTREAGVRNLEREIAKLARKAVKEILSEEERRSRSRREPREVSRRAEVSATARPKARIRSASSRAWPGPKSAASC
jgi:ATP-dependent Lon protease